MFDIWGFLLQTLTASGVAALLLIIKALFKDKLPPKWHFAVWITLAIALLLPVGLNGRYVLFNWQLVLEFIKSLLGNYSNTRVLFPIPIIKSLPETIAEWIFVIYLLGVIIHIVKYLISYIRLRLVLRKGCEPCAEVVARIQQIAIKQKVKFCRVIEVAGLPSAFVCGIFRPILAIPAGKELDDKVILHELLHLKYKDTFWSVIICLFRCVHWCNPFLNFCANVAINDMEARCDQHVLEQLEGEERRDYGRILLSMVNDRFAKTPGSTCINNGGKNIRARIEAIARFKKYPAGMKLVSVCVIILLTFSLVIGAQATEVYEDTNNSVHLSIASAISTPCTTPAGAFDTYGKAILEQNGIYRLMCTPENMRAELAHEIIEKNEMGIAPTWDCGLDSWPDTQSGYYIYNLEQCENNTYEAMLVIKLNYPPDGQAEEEGKMYLAFQELCTEKENGRWIVKPLEDFNYAEADEEGLDWGCFELPALTYTGTASNIKVNVRTQTIHIVDNYIQNNDDAFSLMFGGSYTYDTTPKPNAEFSTAKKSHRVSCTHLGTQEERDLISQIGISYGSIYSEDELTEELQAAVGGTSSGHSNQGRGWTSSKTEAGWGPTINMSGGGSSCEPDLDIELPLCYVADLYLNNELAAEMELYLQEEVTE